MINLLPAEYKDFLKKISEFRLVTTTFFFLFLLVLIAGVLLVPASILSTLKEKNLSAQLELLKKGDSAGAEQTMNKTIADINKSVFLFTVPNTAPLLSTEVLEPLFTLTPSGVAITGVSFKNDTPATLEISGIAKDRQTLDLFVKKLQTHPQFAKVDLPISNFVKDKDIDYKVTCTLK